MSQTYCNTRMEPEEELVQCPYDPVHRILPKRMQTHLIKCRKAVLSQTTSPYYQRALNMVVCKFNSKHHVQKDELDAHHFKCPDKKEFFSNAAQVVYDDAPEKNPGWMNLIDDSALKRQPAGDEETWEDEWQQTYDPMEKINANPDIIHNPQGLSKAKKRDYAFNRRLQAEGLIGEGGKAIVKANDNENWGDEEWECNNVTTANGKLDDSPVDFASKPNGDWDEVNNLTTKREIETVNSHKKNNKIDVKITKGNDGWTEVAPRFRKEKQKDSWDNATREEHNDCWGNDGWDNPSPAATIVSKTNGYGNTTTEIDCGAWGINSSNRDKPITTNGFSQLITNDQDSKNKGSEPWENMTPAVRSQNGYAPNPVLNTPMDDGGWDDSHSNNPYLQVHAEPPVANADDGGWGDGPSINPYLQSDAALDKDGQDEEGWEGEEYTPEPYVDVWGTVRKFEGESSEAFAKRLQEQQEKLKEANSEAWGGEGNDTWTTVIQNNDPVSTMKLESSVVKGVKVKTTSSKNSISFEPPGHSHSKISRNAMEFVPPSFPSFENDDTDADESDFVGDENESIAPEITMDDASTTGLDISENDAKLEPQLSEITEEYSHAPASEGDSSEGSFIQQHGRKDDEAVEDDFVHDMDDEDLIDEKDEVEEVITSGLEMSKKIRVRNEVQQNNKLQHRKHSRGGKNKNRKKRGDNRNRSKSIDKNASSDDSTFSVTSMAVKFVSLCIVGLLFLLMYVIAVIVLLSFSN